MKKDIMFSRWYDNLEGTKSQGFAYKAWCAGWEAGQKPWVSLTDEEIMEPWPFETRIELVRWIEAKSKELNT